jgi:predicted phage terminase large subunit-like protein
MLRIKTKKSAEKEKMKKLLEMKRQIIIEQQLRLEARESFLTFCCRVWPNFQIADHHRYVGGLLEKAMRREPGFTKMVIHEPPQHGKSLEITTLFPAFYLGHFQDDPQILTAYGDQHAIGFSKKIRGIVDSNAYDFIFPGLELSPDTRAGNRWELKDRGGCITAAGVNGAITGKGARLLIMDDPIKRREEAESQVYRESLKEAYRSTLRTRLHNDAIQILVMTRWHQDDLAGWLIKEHGFTYFRLPAIADAADGDLLGRRVGEPLWPERFPHEFLMEQKESLGLYNWDSMYQGNPAPPEGLIFQRGFFKIIDKAPEGLSWVRFWDLAATERTSGDYTASHRMAVDHSGNVYIDGEIRGLWEWPTVRRKIKDTALIEKIGIIGIESQGMQKGMVQECWADPELLNVGIFGIPVPQSKRIRAMSVMARGEAGKLFLVKNYWNEEFIKEFITFDVGAHDDRVDSVSGGMHLITIAHPEMTDLNTLVGTDQKEIDKSLSDFGWAVEESDVSDYVTTFV